jgi:hypothetical protein
MLNLQLQTKTSNGMSNTAQNTDTGNPTPTGVAMLEVYMVLSSSSVANVGMVEVTLKNLSSNKKYSVKYSGNLPEHSVNFPWRPILTPLQAETNSEEDITIDENLQNISGILEEGANYELTLEVSGNIPGAVGFSAAFSTGTFNGSSRGYGKSLTTIKFTAGNAGAA